MQGEIPQVLHLYATKLAVHTNPQVVPLSYRLTENKKKKIGREINKY